MERLIFVLGPWLYVGGVALGFILWGLFMVLQDEREKRRLRK